MHAFLESLLLQRKIISKLCVVNRVIDRFWNSVTMPNLLFVNHAVEGGVLVRTN